jgi:tRNA U34 5-methylaminomethyl-2-thiouridine-forming methyltransferase MnmC
MKLPETWSDIGFEVEFTGDGSPSLRLLQAIDTKTAKGESMHHSGGAAAETELIYGKVIRRCFESIPAPHFLSVGLGLGYVELIVAREALRRQDPHFTLESFEVVPGLISFFKSWLQEGELSPEVRKTYDHVLREVLAGADIDGAAVKALLAEKLRDGTWNLQGALTADFKLMKPAHTIVFDAFSAKTTPELWDEVFLTDFFTRAAHQDSLISTYACRVSLKEALAKTRFAVEIREGFQGKRNSTLGVRGIFTDASAGGTSSRNP